MPIFDNPKTGDDLIVDRMDNSIKVTATQLKRSYQELRRIVHQTNGKTPEQIYILFATSTRTGLTPQDLGSLARVTKTLINMFAPGTIVDDVPEVQITL